MFSISTADGYEQMTIMAPEKALPSIVQLVNRCSFANASRYIRIIRVEKVGFTYHLVSLLAFLKAATYFHSLQFLDMASDVLFI